VRTRRHARNIDITDPNLYRHDPYPSDGWLRENSPI
jgi:hypothetical protein